MTKLTLVDIAEYVEAEGLGYAVQSGLGAGMIENPKLAVLWEKARNLLNEIEAMLPEIVPEED